jgi:hypothetical protein
MEAQSSTAPVRGLGGEKTAIDCPDRSMLPQRILAYHRETGQISQVDWATLREILAICSQENLSRSLLRALHLIT